MPMREDTSRGRSCPKHCRSRHRRPRVPLRVSPDRRRMLDADGQPVLLQGDAAWSLIANTTLDERPALHRGSPPQGLQHAHVNLIEYCFAADPPRNLAGDEPFTTPGDFRTPNEAYMAHAERVLELAADSGLLVILASGLPRLPRAVSGLASRPRAGTRRCWPMAPRAAAPGASTWVAASATSPNIIWSIGGDRNPGEAHGRRSIRSRAVIRAAGVDGICSPPTCCPEYSPLDVFPEHRLARSQPDLHL